MPFYFWLGYFIRASLLIMIMIITALNCFLESADPPSFDPRPLQRSERLLKRRSKEQNPTPSAKVNKCVPLDVLPPHHSFAPLPFWLDIEDSRFKELPIGAAAVDPCPSCSSQPHCQPVSRHPRPRPGASSSSCSRR